MINPVFLSTIIGDFSGITLDVCCEFDAVQCVMTQHAYGIVLLAIVVNPREDFEPRAEIRCTITPEKLRVACGPHSMTIGFTAHEAASLSDFLPQAKEWLWDFFADPEGMDKAEMPPPLVSPTTGFMWSVDDLLQDLTSKSPQQGRSSTTLN